MQTLEPVEFLNLVMLQIVNNTHIDQAAPSTQVFDHFCSYIYGV